MPKVSSRFKRDSWRSRRSMRASIVLCWEELVLRVGDWVEGNEAIEAVSSWSDWVWL